MTTTEPSRGAGLALVIIAAVAFSAKAIFVKLAYRYGVDAVTLLTLRMGFAMPVFAYIALIEERRAVARPAMQQIVGVVALGLVGSYLSSLLDFIGLIYISAGFERMILFSYPTLPGLFGILLFRPDPGRRMPLALMLC